MTKTFKTGLYFTDTHCILSTLSLEKTEFNVHSTQVISIDRRQDFGSILTTIIDSKAFKDLPSSSITLHVPSHFMHVETKNLNALEISEQKDALKDFLADSSEFKCSYLPLKDGHFLFCKMETTLYQSILDLFEHRDLNLAALLPSYSSIIALNKYGLFESKETNNIALLMESRQTHMLSFSNGSLALYRQLDFGIYDMQQFFKDDATSDTQKKSLNDPENTLKVQIWPFLEKLLTELKKALLLFSPQPKSLILMGSFNQLKDSDTYLSQELDLDFHFLDIPSIRSSKTNTIDPTYAELSVGMALGDVFTKTLNFKPKAYGFSKKAILSFLKKKNFQKLLLYSFIILFGCHYIVQEIAIWKLKSTLHHKDHELYVLEEKIRHYSRKKKVTSLKTSDIKFIQKTVKHTYPVSDFLYQLNLISRQNLYLTTLDISQNNVILTGHVFQKSLSSTFASYLKDLGDIPYVSRLKMSLDALSPNFTRFKITLNLKETP